MKFNQDSIAERHSVSGKQYATKAI